MRLIHGCDLYTSNYGTLIRKLLQTNIPSTIIKFIAIYIKGRKAYTTYRNHTSRQRQFKTGVPQGGVLSPTLFNIYTSDLTPPSAPVQVMAYADDITITSTHTSTSAAKKYIQPYLQSTHFHLRGIGRILNLLTFDGTAQLIHALITSCLDFCNSILYSLPNKQIERLQQIQNQAVRTLKRIPRRNHITPGLRELHWLRIHDRIIFQILLLTHKAVNNTAPEYLYDLIRLNVKSTSIRTRASFDPCLLCVPPISKNKVIAGNSGKWCLWERSAGKLCSVHSM